MLLCAVFIAAVGYGDLVPTSWLGRAIGGVVMVIGLLVLGLPIAAIGSSFTDAYKIEGGWVRNSGQWDPWNRVLSLFCVPCIIFVMLLTL